MSAATRAPVDGVPRLEVLHEGRGGHIAIGGYRYAIEHVEGGHFCIHFPGGQRHAQLAAHRALLYALVERETGKWFITPYETGRSHV